MEVCMEPRQISLLVSLDQCAVLSHIGKYFAEVCHAYNSKNYFPLSKSKEKCSWKCLRFASNYIGRILAARFVFFLVVVASDQKQHLGIKLFCPVF